MNSRHFSQIFARQGKYPVVGSDGQSMESIRVAVRIRPEDTKDTCIKLKENVVTISKTKENSLHDTHEFNFDRVRVFSLVSYVVSSLVYSLISAIRFMMIKLPKRRCFIL